MKLTQRATMAFGAQDGAFWGDYMFRFNANGTCRVFDARPLDNPAEEITALPLLAEFRTDPADPVVPHFNAVVFGTEYYAPGDEFPLLYANLYNNYAKAENRLEGTCCIYRLQRTESTFAAALVQVIRIGFTDDILWKSAGDKPDVRPYGNFVIDTDKNLLHVFTMRDAERVTRYFTFRLPKLAEGVCSETFGVPTVTLHKEDILDWFDTDYHLYIQGACCHGGRVYSSEGFNRDIHPSLRVIDPAAGKQLCHVDLTDLGYDIEAEWIDFRGDICYYSDARGNIYEADFELNG
ncbi:MAG: hypothetical protein IJ480_02105 [Clostridia bacterium]|nr:hypothetical protein [Clostridia bacterium]